MPNTTRLDIIRKRTTRLRSRDARRNPKRRDFVPALQAVIDQLPSPTRKMDKLRCTPALLPPSLPLPLSPETPAANKRSEMDGTSSTMKRRRSPTKSPVKNAVLQTVPPKETPRMGFQYKFEPKIGTEKTSTSYEVYSKIFGPPPQLSKTIADPLPTQPVATKLKSPQQQTKLEPPSSLLKRKEQSTPSKSILRNDTIAVPSFPVPAGPPRLQPSSLQRHNRRIGASTLIDPPPSIIKSALPRPATRITSSLPVPTVRRSARVVQKPIPAPVRETAKSSLSSVGVEKKNVVESITPRPQPVVPTVPSLVTVPEKKVPVIETIPPVSQNISVEKRKNKLGGAQRITRDGERVVPLNFTF